MPIHGYGVLRGRPARKADATRRSPHYQVLVEAGKRPYRVAINVQSQGEPDELLYYLDQDFQHSLLASLVKVGDGFTALTGGGDGLALDYVRGRLFDASRMRPLPLAAQGRDNDLNEMLDGVVERAIGTSDAEVFAFGQKYPAPGARPQKDTVFGFQPEAGVHDIHMNQGNAGKFRGDDGTWQDGGLLVYLPKAERWVAVFLAFQSQSFETDDHGHGGGPSRAVAARKGRRGRDRHPMAPLGASFASAARRWPPQASASRSFEGAATTGLEWPPTRPLRAYAFDPSRGRLLGNEMSIEVSRRDLAPGPVVLAGEYGDRVAVVDYDGATGRYYQPVDLDHPRILMSGGILPSESDPRFHQQMVYAVASETIEHFEAALGRHVHWRRGERTSRATTGGEAQGGQKEDIGTLHLFPHAFRSPNAFYSPDAHGILFGYFRADDADPGRNLPGQPVFTCLSHDIIVHETTHAIVDGIRGYFLEQTNVDVPAFHEAFADLAALFRHFSHREVLQDTIERTGGRLFDYQLKPDATTDAGASPRKKDGDGPLIGAQIRARNPLIEIAEQFGEASGLRRGLRSALGTPQSPEPIKRLMEPHARGSILVAAVFDAFFSTYVARTSDLFRIFRAAGGSATPIDLPGPLANLLCTQAMRTAEEFFCICVRALDYCPPVDITFGDFLRAVVTAHWDHDEADVQGVRYTFMQAFRLRGIQPEGARFFSEDALRWPTGKELDLPPVHGLEFGDPNALTDAQKAVIAPVLHRYAAQPHVLERLGLDPLPAGRRAVVSSGLSRSPRREPAHGDDRGDRADAAHRQSGRLVSLPRRSDPHLAAHAGQRAPGTRRRALCHRQGRARGGRRPAPGAANRLCRAPGSLRWLRREPFAHRLCDGPRRNVMAARKTAKKTGKKTRPVAAKRPSRPASPSARSATSAARAVPRPSTDTGQAGLRVRMYRVGFGDFFLLSIPTPGGQEHVLIDCGVFKGTSGSGDIGSIESAVDDLAQVTGGALALVIMTHRHADHIIGFSRCKAQFQKMKVGAVWMPIWESEYDAGAQKFQAALTQLALGLDASLAARPPADGDALHVAARNMLYNATGAGSLAAAGGGTNAASLDLLKRGFGVTPEYYAAGDSPKIPEALAKAGLSARILGPPPVDDLSLMKLMDLSKGVGEYLAASDPSDAQEDTLTPFAKSWDVDPEGYPEEAFREWSPRAGEEPPYRLMEKTIAGAQPTSMYAAAKALDSFLNNQSLVILFTFAGKKLLFVGDAQAGNWEHWLYQTDNPEKSASGAISADGTSVLQSLDFYKVGHHGSTNATPRAVVGAIREGVVAMCSTQPEVYGTEAKGTEVPRIPLLEALGAKCTLLRSDQITAQVAGKSIPPAEGSPGSLPSPKVGAVAAGACWIDYSF